MKRFLKITLLFIVAVATLSFYLTRTPQTDQLDELLAQQSTATNIERAELVADAFMADYSVPSLVIGVIQNGQSPIFISKGNLARGSETAVNEHTYYQLGSLSKTFTAIIARELQAAGQLDFSASILDYLPDTFTQVEIKKLQPITVEHLIRHLSGLPRIAPSIRRVPFGGPVIGDYSLELLINDLKQVNLNNPSGEVLEYSNFGYGVLGVILENAADDNYGNLLQRYVAQSYDMSRTTVDFNHDFDHQIPTPYLPELRYVANQPFDFGRIAPAGGIFSCAADLTNLMTAQMEIYQKDAQSNPLFLTEHTTKWFDEDWAPRYGYGFFQFDDYGKASFGHNGDVDGFASSYNFFPEQGVGYVLLTSMGGSWFTEFERTLRKELLK
ncbi:MAG: serine hydrolase domain-containing protein [Saprospiraceae bacterium]